MSVKKLYVTGGSIIPQSDWTQTDETQADYIKNKPTNLASQDDVAAAIDIIDMGGRNLIVDSGLDDTSNYWFYNGNLTINFDNGYLTLLKDDTGTTRCGYTQSSSKNPILLNPENGQSYTLSAEIMKLSDVDIPSNSTIEVQYRINDSMVRFSVVIPTDLAEGEWTKISGTQVYEFDTPDSVGAYIMLGSPAGGLACRNIKLEKSSLADVWAAINEIKSAINEIKGISEV